MRREYFWERMKCFGFVKWHKSKDGKVVNVVPYNMSLDFREPPCWACRIQSSLKSASNLSSSLGVPAVSTLPSGQTFPYHTYCIQTHSTTHSQQPSAAFYMFAFSSLWDSLHLQDKLPGWFQLMSLNLYMR